MRKPSRSVLFLTIAVLATGCLQDTGPSRRGRDTPVDADASRWIRQGPLQVAVESVRLGRARVRDCTASGSHEVEAFLVATRTRWAPNWDIPRVFHTPYQSDARSPAGGSVSLTDSRGDSYRPLTGLDRLVGRRCREEELRDENPEVADLLVFDPRAGSAEELTLDLPSNCRAKDENGHLIPQPTDPLPFRFRLLPWMWKQD